LRRLFLLLRDDPRNLNVQEEAESDHMSVSQKQRTCLHYASRRTVSMVNYLMIIVLMPILLLGYFLLAERRQMEALLSAGADSSFFSQKGNTALHYLCQRKTTRLVPLLLHRNNITVTTEQDGETPLDIASRLKFKKIVHMLTKKQ
uniref:Ankyrin repeat domain 22 n=1 Tax=Sphaeramia orbicularis TaxID=375764 RepID=A0A673C9R9_9TELE